MGEARRLLPGVPVQALTATATKRVRDDVKRILRLRDPVEVTGSVDRPNISLEVVDGDTMDEEEARLDPHACHARWSALYECTTQCTPAMHHEAHPVMLHVQRTRSASTYTSGCASTKAPGSCTAGGARPATSSLVRLPRRAWTP